MSILDKFGAYCQGIVLFHSTPVKAGGRFELQLLFQRLLSFKLEGVKTLSS